MMQASTSGHLRNESVAFKRSTGKGGFASTTRSQRDGDNETLLSPIGTPISPPRQRLLLKILGGVTLLFLVLHFGVPFFERLDVNQKSIERKSAIQGEMWHLSRKMDEADRPKCKRVMLFQFSGTHGFSSEIFLYLQAEVIAHRLGFTLLGDDQNWNYGSLRDYFLPRTIHCTPPHDWFLASSAVKLGAKRWTLADRVVYSRAERQAAENWLREETLDPTAMNAVKERVFSGNILPEGESIPIPLEEIYLDFSVAARELLRPNQAITNMIRSQRRYLGLGDDSLTRTRKHSSVWGGNQANSSPEDEEFEEEDADDHIEELQIASRSDRGAIIGAFVTEPSVHPEKNSYGVEPSVPGNLDGIVHGIRDASKKLKSKIAPGLSLSRGRVFRTDLAPTVVVFSPQESVLDEFTSNDDIQTNYKVERTSPPPADQLIAFADTLDLEVERNGEVTYTTPKSTSILVSWTQDRFNNLPLNLRILLTSYFVRDLLTLSLYADAFLVSGYSHVGRLALLMAGEEAVIGARDISGLALGGRVRAVDVPWFFTESPETMFES